MAELNSSACAPPMQALVTSAMNSHTSENDLGTCKSPDPTGSTPYILLVSSASGANRASSSSKPSDPGTHFSGLHTTRLPTCRTTHSDSGGEDLSPAVAAHCPDSQGT
eukprot:CAMPEP_0119153402 /NCGR_PEP_ID=MMETSP1310-20130426/49216_1 /TAXON_ID=464262 /ORGANISM="Genus nov. species nov., Strain RCC2339" /LENGTH=107 /DNA_ID=CAMNT_0007145855 /DNA_START=154 /DNA_END=477 /DNA_ORIENTATION=+